MFNFKIKDVLFETSDIGLDTDQISDNSLINNRFNRVDFTESSAKKRIAEYKQALEGCKTFKLGYYNNPVQITINRKEYHISGLLINRVYCHDRQEWLDNKAYIQVFLASKYHAWQEQMTPVAKKVLAEEFNSQGKLAELVAMKPYIIRAKVKSELQKAINNVHDWIDNLERAKKFMTLSAGELDKEYSEYA